MLLSTFALLDQANGLDDFWNEEWFGMASVSIGCRLAGEAVEAEVS